MGFVIVCVFFFLQLGLVGLEDIAELGGKHDLSLDLDGARHEQLLGVGSARGEVNKGAVLDRDHNIGLGSGGAGSDGTLAVLEVDVVSGSLALLVGDLELEDTLDLLDLGQAISRGHGLNASLDLLESGSGLEVTGSGSSGSGSNGGSSRGSLQGLTLELNSSVRDDNGITLDNTDLEDDLVTLAPHGGLESLAGVDSLGEADLDVLERGGVVVAVGVEDVLTGNTE